MKIDFRIKSAIRFCQIAYYGHPWLIEFRDHTRVIVIEDPMDSPHKNYIVEESPSDDIGLTPRRLRYAARVTGLFK